MRFLNMFRPKKLRYHRIGGISKSSNSQTQPLVLNQNQFMEEAAEMEHDDVQVLWAKFSILEKEIVAFKSNLSRLETKFQTKTKEGSNQQEAITSLEQRIDKLEKKLDGIIFRHEAQKEMNSNEITKQGGAIRRIEENNSNLEKKAAELETKINEMTSSMEDTMAVISEFQDKYSSKPQERSFVSVYETWLLFIMQEKNLVSTYEKWLLKPRFCGFSTQLTTIYLILFFMFALIIGTNL